MPEMMLMETADPEPVLHTPEEDARFIAEVIAFLDREMAKGPSK